MNNQLELALQIAINAHTGQVDKAGLPYILHPIEVMTRVDSLEEKVVALLHDVIEDTDITLNDLLEMGIDQKLVKIVDLLTHKPSEDYQTYIEHIANSPMATTVKLADLAHNTDLKRLRCITKQDMERIEKYENAIKYLESY